jgi:hypothetical protein
LLSLPRAGFRFNSRLCGKSKVSRFSLYLHFNLNSLFFRDKTPRHCGIGAPRFGTIQAVPQRRTPVTQITRRNNPRIWSAKPHPYENLKTRIPVHVISVKATVQILRFRKTNHGHIAWTFTIKIVRKKRLPIVFNPQLHVTEFVNNRLDLSEVNRQETELFYTCMELFWLGGQSVITIPLPRRHLQPRGVTNSHCLPSMSDHEDG